MPRVEEIELRLRRLEQPVGVCRRAGVARDLGVVGDRDRALQLRVQDDETAAAVELDPRPAARQLPVEQAGDREVGAAGQVDGACAGERLREHRLRHAGRPRIRLTAEVEAVLPDGGAVRLRQRAGGQGSDQRPHAGRVAGGDESVQLRAVRERVELEPVAGEEPVDGAVVADDVGAVGGDTVRRQVLGVLQQRRVELERARAGRGLRQAHLREHVLEQRPAERWDAAVHDAGVAQDAEVAALLGRRDVAGLERARETGPRHLSLARPDLVGGEC